MDPLDDDTTTINSTDADAACAQPSASGAPSQFRDKEPPRDVPPALTRIEAGGAAVVVLIVAALALWLIATSRPDAGPPAIERVDGGSSGAAGFVPPYRIQVDVNHDSWQRLTLVPGIGVRTAQAIVVDRETRGPFASLDELDRVSGIGPRSLEAWRPYLTVRWPDGEPQPAGTGVADDVSVEPLAVDPAAAERARELDVSLPLDANTASAFVLAELVPGIGPTLAARIVEARTAEHGGPFVSLVDLAERVSGISRAGALSLAGYMTVRGED